MRLDHFPEFGAKSPPFSESFLRGFCQAFSQLFQEDLLGIFDASQFREEAYAKRDVLAEQEWWRNSWHLSQCMNSLLSPQVERMAIYLHSETLTHVWRQMEALRRGFKSPRGMGPLEAFSAGASPWE